MIKRKPKEEVQIEKWMPSPTERAKFKEFLEPYMIWKEETEFEWNGKKVKIKAHKGYKDMTDGRNEAMARFGAIVLTVHAGNPHVAVCISSFTNEFIKSGTQMILYRKYDLLEKLYFKEQFAEQKSMEFYDQITK